MRIRTKLVKWLVRDNFSIMECPVCGKLQSDAASHLWHTRECAVIAMAKHESITPSFQRTS